MAKTCQWNVYSLFIATPKWPEIDECRFKNQSHCGESRYNICLSQWQSSSKFSPLQCWHHTLTMTLMYFEWISLFILFVFCHRQLVRHLIRACPRPNGREFTIEPRQDVTSLRCLRWQPWWLLQRTLTPVWESQQKKDCHKIKSGFQKPPKCDNIKRMALFLRWCLKNV